MLTVVIPFADYHAGVVEHAIASVNQQTIPCDVVAIHDAEGRGAGWARNRGVEQVSTPFVTFLDADDTLEPDFAAEMLNAYQDGHYCYSDWRQDGHGVEAPRCAWVKGRWHIVTALIATQDFRAVGGFDESLTGAEDTDMFYKLTRSGICGIRVKKPLVHYNKGGQRGHGFVLGDHYWPTMNLIQERYKGYPMSCCADEQATVIPPMGDKQDGDIEAMALWQGNRSERGRATGRMYPRMSFPRTAHVDPRDVEAAPHLWRRPTPHLQGQPRAEVRLSQPRQLHGAAALGQQLFANVSPAPEMMTAERAPVTPAIESVVEKARRALG